MNIERSTRRLALVAGLAAALVCAAGCQKTSDSSQGVPMADPSADDPRALPAGERAPAAAGQPPPMRPEPHQPTSAAEVAGAATGAIDDAALEEFAQAFIAVRQVKTQYEGELRKATTRGQAQLIQQRAEAAMAEKLEQEGLSLDEYTRVAMRVEQDPELQQRLEQKLQDLENL